MGLGSLGSLAAVARNCLGSAVAADDDNDDEGPVYVRPTTVVVLWPREGR